MWTSGNGQWAVVGGNGGGTGKDMHTGLEFYLTNVIMLYTDH
jgi:hypothetical protein